MPPTFVIPGLLSGSDLPARGNKLFKGRDIHFTIQLVFAALCT